jgi:hypothetical protein
MSDVSKDLLLAGAAEGPKEAIAPAHAAIKRCHRSAFGHASSRSAIEASELGFSQPTFMNSDSVRWPSPRGCKNYGPLRAPRF